MSDRVSVAKTCKLYIAGGFPRSESGRVLPVHRRADLDGGGSKSSRRKTKTKSKKKVSAKAAGAGADAGPVPVAYVSHGSRKDLRDAVEAAAKAQSGWASRDAYNRGQILHRLAEMLEDRRDTFIAALREVSGDTAAVARRELEASVDRLVTYAGWCDKYAHVLGTHDPVSGPYYAFTVPEPTGVIAVVAPPPPAPSLLPLVHLTAAALCPGNAIVAIVPATVGTNPLPAIQFAEACATSDIPAGVVNLLTADVSELTSHLAEHRGIDGIAAAGADTDLAAKLRAGSAVNLKRVTVLDVDEDGWGDGAARTGPWSLEPFVEMKTIWHPSAT